ncbi:MAG: hypothetical protein ACJA00_005272 [Myxococcota bacterium]
MDLDNVTRLTMKFRHRSACRGTDLDSRLVRHDFAQRCISLNGFAFADKPSNNLTFNNTFPNLGKFKHKGHEEFSNSPGGGFAGCGDDLVEGGGARRWRFQIQKGTLDNGLYDVVGELGIVGMQDDEASCLSDRGTEPRDVQRSNAHSVDDFCVEAFGRQLVCSLGRNAYLSPPSHDSHV